MCDGEICEPVTQPPQPRSEGGASCPCPCPGPGPDEAQAQTQGQTQSQVNGSGSGSRPEAPVCEHREEPLPPDPLKAADWTLEEVLQWAAQTEHLSRNLLECLRSEAIDGEVLLAMTEEDSRDLRYRLGHKLTFGELKKFWMAVARLQLRIKNSAVACVVLGIESRTGNSCNCAPPTAGPAPVACPCPQPECPSYVSDCVMYLKGEGRYIAPEYFKTCVSLAYSFLVTWITSFVMVIVHERVPDMKRYPPLPDIFLDNVPHIPWAFNMCEITGSLLFSIWLVVLIFHKYRMVLLRRFFALAGTVFLLRCVTMLITSLSVPGTHLQCNQKDFAIDDPNIDMIGALVIRMARAYRIWSGLGMSIQGVRTCGDYMFSGHTVALTLLNFFITEYTPRNLYFLHTLSWLLNMFGIFFILAAHEHYSIDVFVAFYITSRLFLYYHTLSNNRALMQSDSKRTRIWFPMFSYFENRVDGMVPNVFDTFGSLGHGILEQFLYLRDLLVVLVKRDWLSHSRPLEGKAVPESEHQVRVTANTMLFPAVNSENPQKRSTTPPLNAVVNNVNTVQVKTNSQNSQTQKKSFKDASVDPYSMTTMPDVQDLAREKKLL
ncbi:hypothetical protein KR018_006042 [Drosophila ironensis]|nr:hypothetical protein KR018_006042 [Drosophila ironensis]